MISPAPPVGTVRRESHMDQPTKPPPTPAKKLQCSLIIPRQERLEPGEGPELAGEYRFESVARLNYTTGGFLYRNNNSCRILPGASSVQSLAWASTRGKCGRHLEVNPSRAEHPVQLNNRLGSKRRSNSKPCPIDQILQPYPPHSHS
ncbi:hypothetical protein DTO169C6_8176 [Paecilomyces variotii]|nr:hypothetical protein DTO169C6_8176 [Paecilomyces variotii]KAJ9351137.1 hypothetical protein DTO027B9_6537 [Paecilomyces variotii]